MLGFLFSLSGDVSIDTFFLGGVCASFTLRFYSGAVPGFDVASGDRSSLSSIISGKSLRFGGP